MLMNEEDVMQKFDDTLHIIIAYCARIYLKLYFIWMKYFPTRQSISFDVYTYYAQKPLWHRTATYNYNRGDFILYVNVQSFS